MASSTQNILECPHECFPGQLLVGASTLSATETKGLSRMTITELESPPETAFPCIICLSWTGTKHLPLSLFF